MTIKGYQPGPVIDQKISEPPPLASKLAKSCAGNLDHMDLNQDLEQCLPENFLGRLSPE
jgi:hypothetical protein